MSDNDKMKVKEKQLLGEQESYAMLSRYGIQVPRQTLARTAREAVEAADAIGYPVVMKVVSPDILHKTDIGGVRLALACAEEVAQAFDEISRNVAEHMPEASVSGISVNQMLLPGSECIIGMTRDPVFGPVIMFGLGGIFAEILKDVSFRLLPLSRDEAREMIMETKGAKMLAGVRGQAPKDFEALIDALISISNLVEENPQIEELDVNPCIVYTKGLIAADVKIIV